VSYDGVDFDVVDGREVNLESAVDQLERYKWIMQNYVDHNCSITVSYSPEEVPDIVNWIHDNWETYVGVSFLYRNDPTKTAADLGYPYLPQEVVTKEAFDEYSAKLLPVDIERNSMIYDDLGEDCTTGGCPIR
jgi:ribonucleoside-triphosphate reductase